MPNNGTTNGFDTKLVKDLAKILRETDLSEIEVENEGVRVRVARQATVTQIAPAPSVTHVSVPTTPPSMEATPPSPAPSPAIDRSKQAGMVPSPMVGTVYSQPEPGAAAFIKVGDKVSQDQKLFIIEAMKTMNPVLSPRAGTVTAILVHDSQPVEFGEPLCVIE
jgi:acetyl-CoA carboxylase biotin carboxyl carrier protein